jgi:signal transduction histidine kinase/ligand-binding sensor domain-containing protein
LPDNRVTGVAQSPDGCLWVATRGGLLRFNGNEFRAMPLLGLPEVPNRVVRSMFLDRKGRMWLGTERGPVVCLAANSALTFGVAEGLPDSRISGMAEDGEGAVWLASASGISRVMDGKCTGFGVAEGLPAAGGDVQVAADAKGQLWFSRDKHVGVYRDGKLLDMLVLKDAPVRLHASAASGLWICSGNRVLKYVEGHPVEECGQLPANVKPRVMFEDPSGALWIGTAADGLFRLKDGVMEKVHTSYQEVDCLCGDREGSIWVGTNGGGLNQVRPRAVALIGREAGLPSESVRSVCEDPAGGLWAAMQNGALARSTHGRWLEVPAGPGWPGGDAYCVAADRQGGLWVGSRDLGLHLLRDGVWRTWGRAEGLANSAVRSILAATNGDLWVATDGPSSLQRLRDGKVLAIATPTGLRTIRAMAEGADGTIWVGTAEGQILRVSGQGLVRESGITEKKSISVRSLHCTPDGALWIGYAGYGVGRLKGGEYARITTAEGLMDDYASQIFSDGRGSMWIAGNRGLSQVSLAEMTAVAEGRAERVRSRGFGRSEGLVSLQPNFDQSPAACRAGDGRLYFAMRSGILMVQPEKVADNSVPPPVVLESVSVDDQRLAQHESGLPSQAPGGGHRVDLRAPNAELRLAPGHRKLEINFAALSFTSPENVQFRYQLDNFDKKWIEAGTTRSATYPQLPAGDYGFHVIACNNAGVWNETGASLKLVVSPFFWQTWWFRGLALAAFTGGVIGIVRYVTFRRLRERMHKLKQEAALHQERARIARDMHDEVGAKLTRLSLLGEMAGGHADLSPRATADVKEISDTARETILAFDQIVWAVNPRNDTLADLINYLCRHGEEFFEGSATRCVFGLPQVIPPVMLPTEVRHQVFLAAKEALNNVLKHAKASEVCIRLILHPEAFELVIHDDGTGFDPGAPSKRAGGGSGMSNLQERIRGIGGRFDCAIQPGQGTRISFYVPIP